MPLFDLLSFSKPKKMRVVCNGNPALRAKSLPVTGPSEELTALSERMIVTMKENDIPGVGLAAPQVGINIRMIVIDTRPGKKDPKGPLSAGEALLNPKMPLALVNPEILSHSAETECACEGCLSLPGVDGEVTRPARVVLRARTIDWQEIVVECGGLLARCLQHEIDHLDGVLFIDHAPKDQQQEAAPQMQKLERLEKKLIASHK